MLAFILLGSLDSVLLTLQDWPFTLRDDQRLTLQSCLSGQFAVYAALLAIDTGMSQAQLSVSAAVEPQLGSSSIEWPLDN